MRKLAKRTNRNSAGLLLLALAAVCLSAGCGHAEDISKPPTPVRLSPVVANLTNGGVRYSANIVPNAQISLAFKSGGYVVAISQRKGSDGRMRSVQSGDAVTKGEILAQVRPTDFTNQLNVARGQLEQAQASYDKGKLDFARANNLYSAQSLPKSQFDAAQAELDSSKGTLESAKANLAQAQTALNDCTLKSPADGWVLDRDTEIGNLVGTGTLAFTLAQTRLVKAVFGVPDTLIANVHLGAPQTVVTTGVPEVFHGRVTSISPYADSKSRVFSVEVTIPNPKNQLKSGMIASLDLGGAKLPQPVNVVPLSAVIRSSKNPNGFAVFVVEEQDGKFIAHEREVQVGETFGNSISVTQGVNVGERVIVVGATQVRDGSQVLAVP
jgi:RND family efflux transporter MFP subunit